jgi:hypothetical protein
MAAANRPSRADGNACNYSRRPGRHQLPVYGPADPWLCARRPGPAGGCAANSSASSNRPLRSGAPEPWRGQGGRPWQRRVVGFVGIMDCGRQLEPEDAGRFPLPRALDVRRGQSVPGGRDPEPACAPDASVIPRPSPARSAVRILNGPEFPESPDSPGRFRRQRPLPSVTGFGSSRIRGRGREGMSCCTTGEWSPPEGPCARRPSEDAAGDPAGRCAPYHTGGVDRSGEQYSTEVPQRIRTGAVA